MPIETFDSGITSTLADGVSYRSSSVGRELIGRNTRDSQKVTSIRPPSVQLLVVSIMTYAEQPTSCNDLLNVSPNKRTSLSLSWPTTGI